MKISDMFKERAKDSTALLLPIHHDAMDVLYFAEIDTFTVDSVTALLEKEPAIMGHEIIVENKDRIKMISARVLDSLLQTNLIAKTDSRGESFYWTLEGDANRDNPQLN